MISKIKIENLKKDLLQIKNKDLVLLLKKQAKKQDKNKLV